MFTVPLFGLFSARSVVLYIFVSEVSICFYLPLKKRKHLSLFYPPYQEFCLSGLFSARRYVVIYVYLCPKLQMIVKY